MGRIAAVLSFERVDELDEKSVQVKIDLGGGNVISPSQFGPAGLDAPPLEGDYAVTVDTPGDSGETVVGYADPENEGVAEGGECRVYSREENGDVAISIILKKDGTIEFGADTDNLVRYSELETAFNDLKTQVQTELTKIATTLGSFAIPPVTPYVLTPLTAAIDKAKIEEFLAPEWEPPV
jgi:hypothetical protein